MPKSLLRWGASRPLTTLAEEGRLIEEAWVDSEVEGGREIGLGFCLFLTGVWVNGLCGDGCIHGGHGGHSLPGKVGELGSKIEPGRWERRARFVRICLRMYPLTEAGSFQVQ